MVYSIVEKDTDMHAQACDKSLMAGLQNKMNPTYHKQRMYAM